MVVRALSQVHNPRSRFVFGGVGFCKISGDSQLGPGYMPYLRVKPRLKAMKD